MIKSDRRQIEAYLPLTCQGQLFGGIGVCCCYHLKRWLPCLLPKNIQKKLLLRLLLLLERNVA